MLLDGDRRVDRRQQGPRRARRAVPRRGHRRRRPPLERRQRAGAVAAHRSSPAAARRDPRRLVRHASRRSTPTTWPTSATSPRSRRPPSGSASSASRSRLEAHDAAELALGDLAALGEQVDVTEHLGQRQVGLGDRDVAPHLLRDLVRRARLGRRSAPAIFAARRSWQREALVDQPRRGRQTGVAVAGEQRRRPASRGSRAASAGRSAAPAGARRRGRRTCRPAAARSADWRRCGRSGGRRRARSPPLGVPEHGVRGRVARAGAGPRSAAVAELQRLAVAPACGSPPSSRPRPRKERDTARSAVTTSRGIPWRSISASASSSSRSASAPKCLDHRREQVERADLGAGAPGEDVDEAEVVDVLVGDDDPLEVLDPPAVRGRARARARRAPCRSSGRSRRASAGRPRPGSS